MRCLIVSLFVLCTLTFVLFTCPGCSNPSGPGASFSLSVADVSCTEAWLNLHINSVPANITINKNGTELFSLKITTTDTTIYDSTLSPNQTYTYQAILGSSKSNAATTKTLDTTSHDFTWQTWTFGGGGEGDSRIADVSIIDENNIWACGEVYYDSLAGHIDFTAYNAVHWDGQKWQMLKVQFYTFCGQQHTGSYQANAIIALSDTDIWLASNNSEIAKWNGSYQSGIICLPVSVSRMWAVNNNSVYSVGALGQIGYYNNGTWQKITSGTSTDIMDVWGTNINGNVTVYCTVSNSWTPGDLKILKINNNKVDSVSWNINRSLEGIWTKDNKTFYVCGDGVYLNKNGSWTPINLPPIYTNGIRGNDENDIFVVGDFGFAAHFNGKSWKYYNELYDNNSGYGRVSIKGNTVVMVGQRNGLGLITVGKRN